MNEMLYLMKIVPDHVERRLNQFDNVASCVVFAVLPQACLLSTG